MLYLLDNYDSFSYNLASYLQEIGADVWVKSAGEQSLSELEERKPEGIVISPGPGRPQDAAAAIRVFERWKERVPILGVCLGHQVIGWRLGASVEKGVRPMHGKVTLIANDGTGIFAGLPPSYHVTRYHSLVLREHTLPKELYVSARSMDGAVMAIAHKTLPVYGVQFHPEAVQTQFGHELLQIFYEICKRRTIR